jgi:hypothetical protein
MYQLAILGAFCLDIDISLQDVSVPSFNCTRT